MRTVGVPRPLICAPAEFRKRPEIDDFGFACGSLDGRDSVGEDRCGHDVAGAGDGAAAGASEVDIGTLEPVGMSDDISPFDADLRTECSESLEVQIDGTMST